MSEPVLITGYGWVSPLGNSAQVFDKNLFEGHSAVVPRLVELPGQPPVYLPVAPCDFDHLTVQSLSKVPLDRAAAMALTAAKDALAHAGLASLKDQGSGTLPSFELNLQGIDPTRVGVFWGSGMAGAFSFDQSAEQIYLHGKRIRPTSVVTIMPNSAAAELALLIKAQGACMTYACACASSSVAMGEALRALRAGWLDLALVGGSEAMLTPGVLASWNALRVLSPLKGTDADQGAANSCRPFSLDRSGFALGEGAGAFILERRGHAISRGIRPNTQSSIQSKTQSKTQSIAKLSGYATNCDATHMTLPDAAGQVRALKGALKDANLNPSDIGYVNAHATATTAGDSAEVLSVGEVLGAQVPISSTKAQFGHMLGAAGALELIAALRALELQKLPPNAHLSKESTDPQFKLNFVGSKGESSVLRHVLSNSFAFGGTNAVLIASLDE